MNPITLEYLGTKTHLLKFTPLASGVKKPINTMN